MISLKEALALTKIQQKDIVFLVDYDSNRKERQIFTMKGILEKFDIKRTFVTEISPIFLCGDYQGFLFTITKRKR